MIDSMFLVYVWREGGEMEFARRLYIKHEIGEQVTPERVRQAMEDEVYDFKPAKYRVVPSDRYVDLEIEGRVVLS